MLKNFFQQRQKGENVEKGKALLSLELAEIREISEILFQKIEKKIRLLNAAETLADKKIVELERLVRRAEALLGSGAGGGVKHHEVSSLALRGMKNGDIADVLGIPVGEVELMLNMKNQRAMAERKAPAAALPAQASAGAAGRAGFSTSRTAR